MATYVYMSVCLYSVGRENQNCRIYSLILSYHFICNQRAKGKKQISALILTIPLTDLNALSTKSSFLRPGITCTNLQTLGIDPGVLASFSSVFNWKYAWTGGTARVAMYLTTARPLTSSDLTFSLCSSAIRWGRRLEFFFRSEVGRK